MTSTIDFSQRIEQLHHLIADADYVLIGAGAGLSAAAGLDYAGEDFQREFHEWVNRYDITDLYTSSFYPFKTKEERWAYWAKHIWFARYRPKATMLYRQLFQFIHEKSSSSFRGRQAGSSYFVVTTNVDGQFDKAGFGADRIFATQGDYAYFQPESGSPKELYDNKEWVERALPAIENCRIPTELIPHTPDGKPVSVNLRCDDTFVEDEHWHQQAARYQEFIENAYDKRLLLLEFGVGFNTPAIIRFPFERMAAQFPHTTLVRFNRDYPQLTTEGVKRFIPFTEDLLEVFLTLS